MIRSLHIENIAVIEKTDIDFQSGFNVLTGETGAGKSIIIDAINAVLGERTSKDLIRFGCDKAEVSALFCDLSKAALGLLHKNGFDVDEDGNLLITRSLSLNGGSIKINGKPATATILREISKNLINIHGQHDNQNLLNPDNHYIYIDLLAENDDVKNEYYAEFKNLNSIRRELNSLETDEDAKLREKELLEYQIKEIENADIKIGEIEEIRRKLKIAENYDKMMTALNNAYQCINGADDFDGAFSLMKDASKYVQSAKDDELDLVQQRIEEVLVVIDDISAEIRSLTQNPQYLDLDADKLRQRLDTLHRLVLKYGGTEESTVEFYDDAKRRLEQKVSDAERIKQLSKLLDDSTERLIVSADKLTKSRKLSAEKFSQSVTQVLKFLDMPDANFFVKMDRGRYTKFGCDVVEFIIGTNAGDTAKPLCKIASGGELSRVMLAIKSVLADKDDVDTLIFDEIDSGISGRAAGKVGIKLRDVSSCRQVVCVTHLAQIAANAKNHLLIEKQVINNRTYTDVTSLSYDQRIKELARIMSGTDITENLYNSAKELLDRSSC